MKRRLKLTVAYDGTNYHGFQWQDNALSVQQVLEEGLAKLFGHEISLIPSGRTDTGVHAAGQVVSFSTTGKIPVDRIVRAAAGVLPPDIVVRHAEAVEASFQARRDARGKHYRYRILTGEANDPFRERYVWHLKETLDWTAMNTAAAHLLGTHDFSAFRTSGSTPTHPVRTLYTAHFTRLGDELVFDIIGDGFLYHMVRNIVGALAAVGRGKLTPDGFNALLASRNKDGAPAMAPASGLTLNAVFYTAEDLTCAVESRTIIQ